MMKVLFCGGSHMAHAKHIIDHWSRSQSHIDVSYHITAGVKIRNWLSLGNEFTFDENSGILFPSNTGNGMASFFPADYDYIVVIGNYFLPRRLLQYTQNWSMPMTTAIKKKIIKNSFVETPLKNGLHFRNNLIDIISQYSGENTRLLLSPDPRMITTYKSLPVGLIHSYYTYLQEFAEEYGWEYLDQASVTIDPSSGATLGQFQRAEGDTIHMNDSFWEIQVKHIASTIS